MNEGRVQKLSWSYEEDTEAKKSDWFWIVGIIAAALAAAAVALGNILFGIVIVLGATTLLLHAKKKPEKVDCSVNNSGIRIGMRAYPYRSLESYCIDHDDPAHPLMLRLKSSQFLAPLISVPLPQDDAEEVVTLLAAHLKREHLEEPLSHKLLEFFGF